MPNILKLLELGKFLGNFLRENTYYKYREDFGENVAWH